MQISKQVPNATSISIQYFDSIYSLSVVAEQKIVLILHNLEFR